MHRKTAVSGAAGRALSSTLAAALIGLAAPAAVAQQPAAPAAAAPAEAVRPVIAGPLGAGIELLRQGKFTEALAKVAEAERVPDRTPYENFVLDQLRGGAAAGAGDIPTAVRSFEAALATGRMPPEEARRVLEGLLGQAWRARDFDRTVSVARRYLEAGGTNPQARRILANALVQKGDLPAAQTELKVLVAADARPAEDLLRLLASVQQRQKDDAGLATTLEQLLRFHPKPAYWRDRLSMVVTGPGFDETLMIDALRLQRAAGAMETGQDDLALAEMAQRDALPGEALAVVQAGYAAGRLGSGADAAKHQALRDRLTKDAAADLKEFERPPAANASANALVNNGVARATAGRADGLALIEQGLARPGLTRPSVAKLRQGWLLASAGRADEARAVFTALAADATASPAAVRDLARLWLIQVGAAPAR